MGAWGPGSFENDDALDFVGELEDEPTAETLTRTFAAVDDDFVQAPDAAAAIAAAEFVAAANGRPSEALGSEHRALAGRLPTPLPAATTAQAKAALARILEPDSELFDLWEASEDHQRWIAVVLDLTSRVGG